MTAPLPSLMADAIATASAHGGTLVKLKGGYWTWPGCPTHRDGPLKYCFLDVPEWHVSDATVRGLVKRGLVVVTEIRRGKPDTVKLLHERAEPV